MKWPWQVTTTFGAVDSSHAASHSGVDLALPMDTPVQSITSGVVEKITHEGSQGFGNAVWLKEPDGYRIVFGHLDKVKAYAGERIHKGDVIGLSGDTGYSTGPHLHIGVMAPNGKWVDPDNYFSPWHNWFHLSSNRVKNSEDEFVVGHVEHWIGEIVKGLARDFGEWALHQIAPIALVICAVSLLGVIAGMVRPRRWAFYSGLIATIAYHAGWAS
ncbi:M23 family metallopeptidase [Alicyclobacillus dauci]|uniref:M23 family metallopeptidase n=1 Tax=Alicyclobacillus dauci TaxID=1475485 RepID=A0ABY6ZBJ2_9BACL|nr:M23 family metallopeptidase [Alicyclobacillus dauci]WAH39491.1 M23 family metallopeptidase [Alicyclobacillus dauci]WAH39551.1 M23 family metallopeptidase [Alicyclobacillus dauci]